MIIAIGQRNLLQHLDDAESNLCCIYLNTASVSVLRAGGADCFGSYVCPAGYYGLVCWRTACVVGESWEGHNRADSFCGSASSCEF